MNDDLAAGFRYVDGATDFKVFSSCLTLVDSIPFFAECKRESYSAIGAIPGRRILDMGCGLGDDAAAIARLVAPGGAVVGIDGSRAMIDEARSRHTGIEGLSFEVADVAELPFEASSFDACRVDRVLQHVADPEPAIREAVRVLRPGGVLVAYDNDWETLTIDSADRTTTRLVLNTWCDRFPSGWIGRRLTPLFQQVGLKDVIASPKTLLVREIKLADRLYCLAATVEQLVNANLISGEVGKQWIEALGIADREGLFFSSLTGFLVRGVKR